MLPSIVLLQVLVVGGMVILTSLYCDISLSWLSRDKLRTRLYKISPYAGLLALIYLFNQSSHTIGQQFSTLIGSDITGQLYALEGDFVASLQELIPDLFVEYFVFVYIFGFSFVLVFPVLAYFVLPSGRYLTELCVAYAINYGGGAICYLLFIAYGPRNVIDHVGEPMYELYPQLASLTGSVNSSANVFPSLHVSLTVTVVLLAWRTRAVYPRWTWIASIVTLNILISTMYLGIHWLIDVVTGVGLAVLSVLVAVRLGTRLTTTVDGAEIRLEEDRT